LLLRQEDRGISVAKNAVAGVYTITRLHLDDTKTYDIVLGIRSERVLSNIFSDVWTFQSKAGSTNIGGAFAAQIAGFNDQVVKFSGTTTLATFQPGYEGFQLSQLKFVM
jgi:hypothetical protein